MKNILAVCALMLVSGVLLAQETPPPPGTGSMQQPVPPAGQSAPAAVPATGQQPSSQSPSAPAAKKTIISPGSVIPVQLTKTVDAKKAKKGDEVVAKVTQNLQATSGQVIVPKDTKVVGHVIQAQPRSKEQKESQLSIAFDRMDVKGGEPMQLPMSIQAVIAPPSNNPANASNSGSTNEPPSASPSGGNTAPTTGGARGGMGGSYPNSQSSSPENAGSAPSEAQNTAGARPQITGETRGVVGISNLTLAAAPDSTQGSLLTSEKNNVKLEDGTFLLLRVSPQAGQSPATQPTPQNPQR